jgi:hypothetical protein
MSEDSPFTAAEVEQWKRVIARPELLSAAARVVEEGISAATVERLRGRWEATEATIALALVEARSRARSKFARSEELLCDRQAVEQASGERVAAWKAERFARALAVEVSEASPMPAIYDLCCGMGGDAMALAARAAEAPGASVVAVDRSPLRAWMAAANARCSARVADVAALLAGSELDAALVHCDPARRDESRAERSLTPTHEPPLEQCVALARRARGAALKLGPGLDPACMPDDADLEWISDDGTLVQLVAWWGVLREPGSTGGQRRATRIGRGGAETVSLTGPVEEVPQRDRREVRPGDARTHLASILAVPDPALERSRLLGHFARSHGLAEAAFGLGILTADRIESSPWIERAAVLAELPFDEAAVIAELRRRGASRARVRTRGAVADADRWTKRIAKALSGGEPAATPRGVELDCFLLRFGQERRAIIAEPLADR